MNSYDRASRQQFVGCGGGSRVRFMDFRPPTSPTVKFKDALESQRFEMQSWNLLIAPRLKGYLAFPLDEQARTGAWVSWLAVKLDQVPKWRLAQHTKDALCAYFVAEIDAHGGYSAIARALGAHYFDDRLEAVFRNEGYLAGQVLSTVRSIDVHHRDDALGGASVRKALEIMDRVGTSKQHKIDLRQALKINRDKIGKAWSGFKDVAHVWAALSMVCTQFSVPPGDAMRFPLLANWLSWSLDYQQWAVAHRAHGQTLATLNDPWRVPEFVALSSAAPVRRLDGEHLVALRNYRAPSSEP